jgi:hypothetical protein
VVQAVDSGKLVRIDPSDLQPLSPMFRNVQPFAMKAKISGLEVSHQKSRSQQNVFSHSNIGLKSGPWTREKRDDFETRVLGKMFICTLVCVKNGKFNCEILSSRMFKTC